MGLRAFAIDPTSKAPTACGPTLLHISRFQHPITPEKPDQQWINIAPALIKASWSMDPSLGFGAKSIDPVAKKALIIRVEGSGFRASLFA